VYLLGDLYKTGLGHLLMCGFCGHVLALLRPLLPNGQGVLQIAAGRRNRKKGEPRFLHSPFSAKITIS
jgi:hypothetical protein